MKSTYIPTILINGDVVVEIRAQPDKMAKIIAITVETLNGSKYGFIIKAEILSKLE